MNIIQELVLKADIVKELRQLGINEGDVIEVHSSLSQFGYVVGGGLSVVEALMETVGPEGTIVMAFHNSNNSEPAKWCNPPVALDLIDTIRDNIPAYHPKITTLTKMGAVVECFRHLDNVSYSDHPTFPLIAWGKYADVIVANQSINFPMGDNSPLERLYDLDTKIVLLGVSYDNCTGMHLAEYMSKTNPIVLDGAAVYEKGQRVWKKYLDLELDPDKFLTVGEKMESKKLVNCGKIGKAEVKVFDFKQAIAYTYNYELRKNGK
ncbi:MAG: aminoglycoside N(3)-acetyltransferase [Erysipelotrichaceae bacterium]